MISNKNRITESASAYNNLELMSTHDILVNINIEDKSVPLAIEKAIPQIENLVNALVEKLNTGGRLFYMGAGTSGRLGIVDASECPPTYGVEHGLVNGIIAGGDTAIRKAVEFAEDDRLQGWKDLLTFNINPDDFVIGITASGSTPYVIGAIQSCNDNGVSTACIVCNPASELASIANFPVEVITGPEFVTGSTRMKAGTAQKLVLNMISTSAMIKIGRVLDNKMINMQLSNDKLIDRGAKMLMKTMAWDYERAKFILLEYGSVREVLKAHKKL
jgi:N-acetylmuramic acid 6-phosphate etherase